MCVYRFIYVKRGELGELWFWVLQDGKLHFKRGTYRDWSTEEREEATVQGGRR